MVDGFINLNKPAGFTSHDAVNVMRRIFRTRKVGHGGTLDPAAVGVLPIAVGRATKFIEYLADCDKTYRADIFFSVATDSGDMTGNVITRADNFRMPNSNEIDAAIKNFIGEVEQTPPKFSAIKINGRKAYDLARKNIDFEIPRRTVIINRIEILGVNENIVSIEVDCSKGTYIRTLAVDIAASLNLPAAIKFLQRIRVGNFTLANSSTLDDIKLLPVDECLSHLPRFNLREGRVKAFCNGLPTNVREENSRVRVYADDIFLGVGKICAGELRSDKLF